MTEEDTFLALKRIPFNEIFRKLKELAGFWDDDFEFNIMMCTARIGNTTVSSPAWKSLDTGWEFGEFVDECKRRIENNEFPEMEKR